MANKTILPSDIWSNPFVFHLRSLFHIVTPGESSFKEIDEVPRYVDTAVPYFVVLIALETLINYVKGHHNRLPRWDDAFSSLAAGTLSLLPLMVMRNIEIVVYVWIYDNYVLYPLDWNSPWTWIIALLGVEFGFYWLHRFTHEFNFAWTAHQVHHSSEDYNLTTALRQPVFQRYTTWIFYLPMALFVPPSIFLVHLQFNLIYQFWVHTEVVDTLGPLEWILNTPSHHRVHHGRNRYCIDKNYGGVLIIFDRLFGTFEKEQKKEEIAYGLVQPLNSWDPIYTQLGYLKYILFKAWYMKGFSNKIGVLLNGPGWAPGKPRLGIITDIPDIKGPVEKYSTPAPMWLNIYLYFHLACTFLGKDFVNINLQHMPLVTFASVLYIIWSITNIGHFYEQKWFVPYSELLRCIFYLLIDFYLCSGSGTCSSLTAVPRVIMGASTVIMLVLCVKQFTGEKPKLE